MKIKFNIRVRGEKGNTTDVMSLDAKLIEVNNIKFVIHREAYSNNNISKDSWTVSEYYTGMSLWQGLPTQKECINRINQWFEYNDMTSRLKSFNDALEYGIKTYGQINGEG